MKLPRDLSGRALANALGRLGYKITRQTGSHIRLTTQQTGEHHITIPDHAFLKIGVLGGILREVEAHLELARDEVLARLQL